MNEMSPTGKEYFPHAVVAVSHVLSESTMYFFHWTCCGIAMFSILNSRATMACSPRYQPRVNSRGRGLVMNIYLHEIPIYSQHQLVRSHFYASESTSHLTRRSVVLVRILFSRSCVRAKSVGMSFGVELSYLKWYWLYVYIFTLDNLSDAVANFRFR